MHYNKCNVTLWDSNMNLSKLGDLFLSSIENDNYPREKRTPTIYHVQENDATILDVDLLADNSWTDNQILQAPKDSLGHQED